MKTFSAKSETVRRHCVLFDAKDQVLGRLAAELAHRLRGKHRPDFTPHVDVGDMIVVINASQLRVTGRKSKQKIYYRHTGYPGGLKQRTFVEQMAWKPEDVLYKAVKGMLPKGPLGVAMLKKMKVYAGAQHPHAAQRPVPVVV